MVLFFAIAKNRNSFEHNLEISPITWFFWYPSTSSATRIQVRTKKQRTPNGVGQGPARYDVVIDELSKYLVRGKSISISLKVYSKKRKLPNQPQK